MRDDTRQALGPEGLDQQGDDSQVFSSGGDSRHRTIWGLAKRQHTPQLSDVRGGLNVEISKEAETSLDGTDQASGIPKRSLPGAPTGAGVASGDGRVPSGGPCSALRPPTQKRRSPRPEPGGPSRVLAGAALCAAAEDRFRGAGQRK